MAAAPRPLVRTLLTVAVPLAMLGALGARMTAAHSAVTAKAAVRIAESMKRVYLPLVGHFSLDQLPTPVSPPPGPSPTARATGGGVATPTGTTPASPPPTTPRPTATRPSGGTGGGQWANFTLSREVTALAYDASADRLWAGTTSGLVAWDVKARTSTKATVADGLLSNTITAVAVDAQHRIWVGHDSGVSMSEDGAHWRALRDEDALVDAHVDAIAGDKDGGTWFGTTTGLVHRTPDDAYERVDAPDEAAFSAIPCALADGAGNVWFGTDGQGLIEHSATGEWQVLTEADGLPDSAVFSLGLDGTGRLLAGTGAGLARREPNGAWTVFATWRGASGANEVGRVDALAVAASGDVWLTAQERTLRLPAGAGEVVENSQELLTAATALTATPDGAVWFGFEAKLARRASDGAWSDWLTDDVLPAGEVNAIAVGAGAGGGTWFGTANGVAHRDPAGGWRRIVSSPNGWGGDGMAVGADGHAWVVGGDGLIEVDPSGEQRLHHVDAALPFARSHVVSIDPAGRPWIGIDTGTSAGPNIAWREADGRWQSAMLSSGLNGRRFPYVGVISFDHDGALWAGSLSGVLRRDADGTTTGFTTRTGLFSDLVKCIEVDAAGRVWVGTLGDYNFDSRQWEDGGLQVYDHGAWTRYTKADGLVANGDVNAIAFDGQGGAWVATKDGLSHRDGAGRWTSHTKANGLPGGAVLDVAVAANGDVWAVIAAAGAEPAATSVARLAKGGGWQTVAIGVGPTGDGTIRSVTAGPNGGVVFGGLNHVVWRAEDNTQRAAFTGVDLVGVRAAAVDAAGNAYFGGPGGLARRAAAGTWRMWTRVEGLPDGEIRAIQVDAAGDAWLGLTKREVDGRVVADSGGVARLDAGGTWTRWTRKDGVASDRVNDVAVGTDGDIWVATEPEAQGSVSTIGGGISRRSAGGAWTTFDEGDGVADDRTSSVVVDGDGIVWVGGAGGISRLGVDGAWSVIDRADGLPSGEIATLALGADGDLWVGTSDGAGVLHADGTGETYGTADGLGDGNVLAIAVGDDAVWFGHLFHGVSRMALR